MLEPLGFVNSLSVLRQPYGLGHQQETRSRGGPQRLYVPLPGPGARPTASSPLRRSIRGRERAKRVSDLPSVVIFVRASVAGSARLGCVAFNVAKRVELAAPSECASGVGASAKPRDPRACGSTTLVALNSPFGR